MGMSSTSADDAEVKRRTAEKPHTLWSVFAGGEKLAGGTPAGGKKRLSTREAAHERAVAAGKAKVALADKPALQKGMGAGGFGDRKVEVAAHREPLWDALGLQAPKADTDGKL